MALGGTEAIGELAIKVVPDTSTFGKDVSSGVGASVSKASGIALGAVVAIGGGLLAIGTQLDDAYDSIRANTTATGDDLLALNAVFDNVAKTSTGSLDETSTAVSTLYTRLGLTGDQLDTTASQMLDLVQITGEDLGGALDATSSVMSQFGVKGEDINTTLDAFFNASKASGTSVTELATQVNKSGGALQGLGLDLNESINFLGLMNKNGVDANKAVNGLAKTIKDAAAEGVPAREALGGIFDAIKNAPNDTDAAAQAIELFGQKAGPQLAQAIRGGTLSLDDLAGALGAGTDTIEGVANETADAAETFKELKNTLAITLGPAANKLFASFGESAKNAAPAIILVVEALVPLLTAVSSLPAPVLAAVIGMLAAGVAFGKVIGPISQVISVIKTLTLVVAANPWILLIAATVALVIVIVKNWDKIKETVGKAVDFIKGLFDKLMEFWKAFTSGFTVDEGTGIELFALRVRDVFTGLRDFFIDIWDKIKGVFESALNLIETITRPWVVVYTAIFSFAFNAISSFIESWSGRLQALFSNLFSWIGTAFTTVTSVVMAIWQPFWDTVTAVVETAMGVVTTVISVGFGIITSVFTTAWNVLSAITSTVWGVIQTVVGTGVGIVKGLLDTILGPIGGIGGALETMRNIFQTVFDKVKGIMQDAFDFVKRLAKQIGDAVKDALGPVGDIAGAVGGVVGGAARLLGFDEGGVVPGPKGKAQLILAHGGETILPTHKAGGGGLAALVPSQGGSGGMTVQGPLVSITGPVSIRNDQDIQELSRFLADDANRALRATGKVGNAS